MKEYLYRYDTTIIDTYDGPRVFKIECQEYEIINRTPKGCWILINSAGSYFLRTGRDVPPQYKKFVLDWFKGARRRWAYPTKELAYESYCIRKYRQLEYLESQVRNAKIVNQMIDKKEKRAEMIITRLRLADEY